MKTITAAYTKFLTVPPSHDSVMGWPRFASQRPSDCRLRPADGFGEKSAIGLVVKR